jgi:GAG-pre-integrase domain
MNKSEQSKDGVPILRDNNWSEFARAMELQLSSVDAWLYANGTLPIPVRPAPNAAQAAQKNWDRFLKKAGAAISLFNNGVDTTYKSLLTPHTATFDIRQMWVDLETQANRANDGVFIGNMRNAFFKETLNSPGQTIRQYERKLRTWSDKIIGTTRELTDADILEKILNSLPETDSWKTAKIHVQSNGYNLNRSLDYLSSCEDTRSTSNNAASASNPDNANSARNDRPRGGGRYRGRGRWNKRGRRGGGRGGGRGGRRNDGGDRDNYMDGVECFWCKKKGHMEKDCYAYKEYKERYHNKQYNKRGARGGGGDGSANLARDETQSQATRHLTPYASSSALHVKFDDDWFLDSGASQDYSGVRTDFLSLKRWESPRWIRIANDLKVESEGWGEVKVGRLTRKYVWYVPAFKALRLMSVHALTSDGYGVDFRGDSAMCHKDGALIFEAHWRYGSYIVNEADAFIANGGDVDNPKVPDIWEEIDSDEDIETMEINPLDEDQTDLMHRRLGHINHEYIKKLASHSIGCKVGGVRRRTVGRRACRPCLAGKLKESFSKKSDSRRTQKGHRLHADCSGILPESIRGFRYFLLVIDDATRCC